jgi:hypothetical protein
MAIESLKSHKSPGIDEISVELIKVKRRKISSEFRKLINSGLEYGGIASAEEGVYHSTCL